LSDSTGESLPGFLLLSGGKTSVRSAAIFAKLEGQTPLMRIISAQNSAQLEALGSGLGERYKILSPTPTAGEMDE
jgi:hypothetical protein